MTSLTPDELEDLRLILTWLRQARLPDKEYAEIPCDTWRAVRDAGNNALTRVL